MTEGHDDQDATERNERVARAQSQDDERPTNEFDKRDHGAHRPKRPNRQKSVRVGKKQLSGMLNRSQLKHLHGAGHEENQSEDKAREKQCPSPIEIRFHGQIVAGKQLSASHRYPWVSLWTLAIPTVQYPVLRLNRV